MKALTVFLAPSGPPDGVQSLLTDLSAAGLLDPFVWITDPTDSGPPRRLVRVESGRARDVTVQQIVSERRIDVLRICVLVPLLDGASPLSVTQERAPADLLASTLGSVKTVRVRCLLTRPGVTPPPDVVVAVDGWHNIVIAPEDSLAPGQGHVQLQSDSPPTEVGRFSAPAIAALLGLWAHLDHTPLDDDPVVPGRMVRLARSFYRKLDTADIEAALRRELLDQSGSLPLPSDQRSQAVYANNADLANSTMAEAFWTKHAAVLPGRRRAYEKPSTKRIGLWAALKEFFAFMWSAIKNAPAEWYARVVDELSTAIAVRAQKELYGSDSAYEVVVNGRTARGERADWTDIAAASSQLSANLLKPEERHGTRSDLSAAWQDYSRAAMTLADAGVRSSELPPISVGANRGVIASAADIVPGPQQRFTGIPGVIAANLEIDGVDCTDPLGIDSLRYKLRDLERTPEFGLQARTTLTQLDAWQRQTSRSFGAAVGSRLAQAFNSTLAEVQQLWAKIRAPGPVPSEPPERNKGLSRWIQLTVLLLLIITGGVAYLMIHDIRRWWWVLIAVVATYMLSFLLFFRAFMRNNRELFRLQNRRENIINQRKVDEENFEAALRDLDRLAQAYGEYLSWSRALGAFLAAPLGPDNHQQSQTLRISWGLPMCTAVGFAAPQDDEITTATRYLRRDLFSAGWLSAYWENLVVSAQPPPPGSRGTSAEDSALWTHRGAGSGSALDHWSTQVFTGHITSSGADVVWQRALGTLTGSMSELIDTLISRVDVAGQPAQRIDDFFRSLDKPAPPAGSFDHGLLTDVAVTCGAGKVFSDIRTPSRNGIGMICAATQLSDAMSEDYLKARRPDLQEGETAWEAAIPASPAADLSSPLRQSRSAETAEQFRAPEIGNGFGI